MIPYFDSILGVDRAGCLNSERLLPVAGMGEGK